MVCERVRQEETVYSSIAVKMEHRVKEESRQRAWLNNLFLKID